jgi:hypothetical protein
LNSVRENQTSILCNQIISNETLAHSLAFFNEIGLKNGKSTYFSEEKMDGITFNLKIQITDFATSNMGHRDRAPEEHEKLFRYFNQLLIVNGCEKSL